MRNLARVAAFVLLILLASPISAQQAVGFGGVNPSAIVNQPIASGGSSSLGIPLFDHSIHLRDFLPNLKTFSNASVFGQSTYPTPDNMPGLNYLQAFGFSQPSIPTSSPPTATKKKRIPPAILLHPDSSATTTSK
jgi:hypothetical protein